MATETMNKIERTWAAIRLEKPDRVPVEPIITNDSAGALTGRTMAQVQLNPEEAAKAIFEVYDNFGGWDYIDVPAPLLALRFSLGVGMKVKLPGIDLPENYTLQPLEQEIVTEDDLDIIGDIGWFKFADQYLAPRLFPNKTPEDIKKETDAFEVVKNNCIEEWKKREVCLLIGDTYHPFFRLSLGRSLSKFAEDIYFNKEKLKKALKKMTQESIEKLIADAKANDSKLVRVTEERGSAFFYPLHVFEEFWMPHAMEIVDALHSEGIVMKWHLDGNWDKNMEYFKKFPKGSMILHFDGMTDIFQAKEVVKNHLCLMGDVHPSLMTLGKPEEVEAYCKKVIDEVGYDGGFILACGCSAPTKVTPENLRAMLNTAKTYELGK